MAAPDRPSTRRRAGGCARTARRFWASVVITALRDESGDVRGFSKITRDLTDRKQAEDEAPA